MKLIADTHTHTLASGHAYSTITENMTSAARKGLLFLAATDHAPAMPGSTHEFYFGNLRDLPDRMSEVYLLRGCEVNVMGPDGSLDLPDRLLDSLEWVIASMHTPAFQPAGKEEHTAAWMSIAKNPLVDVIGHCGDERFCFDHEPVIRAFAENGKIVEINANSFVVRPGSPENCRDIALLCKKYGVRVVVNSDSHFHEHIGRFDQAARLLEEIHFPEELIVNSSFNRFAAVARETCGGRREFI